MNAYDKLELNIRELLYNPDNLYLNLDKYYREFLASKNEIESFCSYMDKSVEFAIYSGAGDGTQGELMYLGLGLTSEAGEVAGVIKKFYRDGQLDIIKLREEIGDVCWYIANLCNALGFNPDSVLRENLQKLTRRKINNQISGSGDR